MEINIVDIQQHDEKELVNKLNLVTLKSYSDIKIYERSHIYLKTIENPIQTLYPCQYYLSKVELMKVRNLNYVLKKYGVNIFYLNGYITITLVGENQEPFTIDLLPPVIEYTLMPDNSFKRIVCDGMHRIHLSILEHSPIQCIYVESSNILREFPYYAYPIPNTVNPDKPAWHEVKIYDTIPEDMIKRWPRIENHKSLYRNFDSVFQGVSGRHIKK